MEYQISVTKLGLKYQEIILLHPNFQAISAKLLELNKTGRVTRNL